MNELIYSCSEALLQPTTPVCATDYGERVVTFALSKTMLWSTVPTASDFNLAWTNGDVSIYPNIVNGHRVFLAEQEIEVIHKEWKEKEYRIEGRTRRVDEAVARATEKLNRYPVLYVWYITDKNWCFGGYECSTNLSLRILEGKGIPSYISFTFDFVDLGVDLAGYDPEYQYMPQYIEIGSVTSDSTLITVDSTLITSDRI